MREELLFLGINFRDMTFETPKSFAKSQLSNLSPSSATVRGRPGQLLVRHLRLSAKGLRPGDSSWYDIVSSFRLFVKGCTLGNSASGPLILHGTVYQRGHGTWHYTSDD